MKIDRKLNLVVPVEGDDGSTTYIHSSPIGREVFEKYFLVISKTFARIYGEGLGFQYGPRVAFMLMRETADQMGSWDDVRAGLVAEMRRLTNVIVPGEGIVPYEDAVKRGLLDADDVSEVDNAIAFFIVAYRMHRRSERELILDGASKLWGAQITSLNSTEFAASLQTSTPAASSGESQTT